MIKTIIIDAEEAERDEIASLLSAHGDIEVQACGKDTCDALKLAGRLKPDIAILDSRIEFIRGEELPPLISARSPSTNVVVMTSATSDYQLFRALSNKAAGFVYKKTDMEKLPDIVKQVSEGGCFISPRFAAGIVRIFSTGRNRQKGLEDKSATGFCPGKDPLEFFSRKELQIIVSVARGLDNREIAGAMNLAEGTVRNYISTITRKAGLRGRWQMAFYAFIHGLVPLNTTRSNKK